METWLSDSSKRGESCREPSPRASGDSVAPSYDESYERPPSRAGWYSGSDYPEYNGHRSEPRASYSHSYADEDTRHYSTSSSSTPERNPQKDSKDKTIAWHKNKSPRHKSRPRYKRIARGWTEVFSTISEEPTMEEEYGEEYKHDWSSLSTGRSSIKTTPLTSTSCSAADSVPAAMGTGDADATVVCTLSQVTATYSEDAAFGQSLHDSWSTSSACMGQAQECALKENCPTALKAEGLQMLCESAEEVNSVDISKDFFRMAGPSLTSTLETSWTCSEKLVPQDIFGKTSSTRVKDYNDFNREGIPPMSSGEEPTVPVVLRNEQGRKNTSTAHPQAQFYTKKIIGWERVTGTNGRSRLKLVAILLAVLLLMGSLLLVRANYQSSLRPDRATENDRVAEKAFSAEIKINFTDSRAQRSHPLMTRRKMHAPHVNQWTLHKSKATRMYNTNISKSIPENITKTVPESTSYDVTVRRSPSVPATSLNKSLEFGDNDNKGTDLVRGAY